MQWYSSSVLSLVPRVWRHNSRALFGSFGHRSVHNEDEYYESAADLPTEAKVVIYGDELVSKALAYHLSDSLGANVLVIRGNGIPKSTERFERKSALNSFYVTHLVVSNPRSSLLIRHSCDLFNMTNCGAIYLAQTEERVKSFKRMISISKLFIPKESGSMELLSPEGRISKINCEIFL